MADDPAETEALLARAATGDGAAWGALLTIHQERLARMVAFRMDPRLRGRVDAADVVQDAFADATENRHVYFAEPAAPLFLWLRRVVSNKLLEVHRHHLGTRMRDVKRELPLDVPRRPDDTAAALCAHLTAGLTRPSAAAAKGEVRTRLAEALDGMDATETGLAQGQATK